MKINNYKIICTIASTLLFGGSNSLEGAAPQRIVIVAAELPSANQGMATTQGQQQMLPNDARSCLLQLADPPSMHTMHDPGSGPGSTASQSDLEHSSTASESEPEHAHVPFFCAALQQYVDREIRRCPADAVSAAVGLGGSAADALCSCMSCQYSIYLAQASQSKADLLQNCTFASMSGLVTYMCAPAHPCQSLAYSTGCAFVISDKVLCAGGTCVAVYVCLQCIDPGHTDGGL